MDDRTITLTRSLAAPVDRVWSAWTDPAVLPRWFGPEGITCVTKAIDIREGGEWRFTMEGWGNSFPNRHRYTAIRPMTRIAFLMDDGSDEADPIRVEVSLAPEGTGTRLTQVMTFPSDEAVRAAREMGAEKYGYQTMAKLAAIVEAPAAADDRTLVLTRHIAAPVARVWQAWTDPAILPRWFGPEGWTCNTHHIDLREGGEWRFTMAGHGMSFENRHRHTKWVPGERIEFLMDGVKGEEDAKQVVVTMVPEGTGTRITQVMSFADAADLAAAHAVGAQERGMETLAKLAAMVEG